MMQKTEYLFISMHKDIDRCGKKGGCPKLELECRFQSAIKYWNILKEELSEYCFEHPCEEIRFFKKLKPLFVSEIEYYGLKYHAELFLENTSDPVTLQRFWKREGKRLQKFIDANSDFYDYYKSGDKSFDEIWFLRANNDFSYSVESKVYEQDERSATSHDHLVSTLIALEKYDRHVNLQLKASEHNKDC